MNARSSQIWEKAHDALRPKDKDVVPLTLTSKPLDLVGEVEKYIKQSKGKPIKLLNGESFFVRDLLQKVSRWIKKFVEVGDVAVQYDPGHASLPWALVRLVLQMSMNNIEKHAAILEGIETVSYMLAWSKIEEAWLDFYPEAHAQLEEEFVGLYNTILRFMARSLRFLQNKPHRIVTAFFSSDSKFQAGIREMLHRKQKIESFTLQISGQNNQKQLKEILAIENQLVDLHQPILRIEQTIVSTSAAIDRIETQDILDWASTIPYHSHFKLAEGKALEGTGQWLFQDTEFSNWQNSSRSQMLWLRGSVGTGKSTLISMFIQSLVKDHEKHHTPYPVYFYCLRDSAEPERASPEHILRCLMRQVSDLPGGPSIHHSLKERFKRNRVAGKVSANEASEIIVNAIETRPLTYIMVDALDECDREKRKVLINSLKTILTKASTLVKIFVTSRDTQPDIARAMNNYPAICIEAARNQPDIDIYVKYSVENAISNGDLLGGHEVAPELQTEIRDKLCSGADGMFRWVELQLQFLCTFDVPRVLRKRLGKLSPGLEEIYGELYDFHTARRDPEELELVTKLLSWLLVAQRPISTMEMLQLVCTPSEPDVSSETMAGMCFDLVRIDPSEDQFRFAHLSVREFLEKRSVTFAQTSLHIMASLACLDMVTNSKQTEIQEYAAVYWPIHAEQVAENGQGSTIEERVNLFFEAEDRYTQWMDAVVKTTKAGLLRSTSNLEVFHRYRYILALPVVPLLAAAYFGLTGNVQRIVNLLKDPLDLEAHNSSGQTALDLASVEGHGDTVKFLVKAGAKISGTDRNTLVSALKNDRFDIIKLLVEIGTNIDSVGGDYGTALQAAVCLRNIQSVEILLNLGADVNAIAGMLGTPLQAASGSEPNIDIVKLLLEHGADANLLGGGKYGTVLQVAASYGNFEVVELLLQNGADINLIGGTYGTALNAATAHRNIEIVKLLLQHGADVNIAGGLYGTALHTASLDSSSIKILKLLLEHGADANIAGGQYGTALQAAIGTKPCTKTLKLLLEHGADVNMLGGKYGSALQAASYRGNIKAVELLLKSGANINTIGGRYGSALQAASYGGHFETVKLLLEQGADIYNAYGPYGTALQTAEYAERQSMKQKSTRSRLQPVKNMPETPTVLLLRDKLASKGDTRGG